MNNKKKLGVWMDNSSAHLIDLEDKAKCFTIHSDFTYETKVEALNRSESIMNNKRQKFQEEYFKNIGDKTLDYDQVLLFGPTDAKKELHNYLAKDGRFKDIHFDVETSEKMTKNQEHAFVKSHFEQ